MLLAAHMSRYKLPEQEVARPTLLYRWFNRSVYHSSKGSRCTWSKESSDHRRSLWFNKMFSAMRSTSWS